MLTRTPRPLSDRARGLGWASYECENNEIPSRNGARTPEIEGSQVKELVGIRSPCRIDSGWRRIRILTRIRDYFDARALHKHSRQYIYHTSSPGKLQDTCCNAHARVQRTSEAPNVP